MAALAGVGWFVSVALSFIIKGRNGSAVAQALLEHPIGVAVNGFLAVAFLSAAWLLTEERRSGAILLLALSLARIVVAFVMGDPSMVNLIVALILPAAAYSAYRDLSPARAED